MNRSSKEKMEIKSKTIAHEVIELESDNGIAVSFIVKDKLNNFLFTAWSHFVASC